MLVRKSSLCQCPRYAERPFIIVLRLVPLTCSSVFFFFQAEDGIRDADVTGVQTCALPISTVRAPGTIQLDERRVSVVAMRSESFVLKVADVTTGSHVVKGQLLMEVYSPSVTSAAAEYLATITSKTTSGDVQYGRGSRQRLVNLDVPEAAISAIEKSRAVPTSIGWTSPRDGIVL